MLFHKKNQKPELNYDMMKLQNEMIECLLKHRFTMEEIASVFADFSPPFTKGDDLRDQEN